jgi:histone H2A
MATPRTPRTSGTSGTSQQVGLTETTEPGAPTDLNRYFTDVFRSLSLRGQLGSDAAVSLNQLLGDLISEITRAAAIIAQVEGHSTVGPREIEAAIDILLPNDFIQWAQEAANFAITSYNNPRSQRSQRREQRAQLILPVSRIENRMRQVTDALNLRLAETAPVYMAAVIEYLALDLLTGAQHVTEANNRVRIANVDLFNAIRNDRDLTELFAGWVYDQTHS